MSEVITAAIMLWACILIGLAVNAYSESQDLDEPEGVVDPSEWEIDTPEENPEV